MPESRTSPRTFWRSPAGLVLMVSAALGVVYIVTGHLSHLLGILPYLVLAACPLMHGLTHRGHGHGAPSDGHRPRPDSSMEAHNAKSHREGR